MEMISIILAATIAIVSADSGRCARTAASHLDRIAADDVGKEVGGISMLTKLGEWKTPGKAVSRCETTNAEGMRSVVFEYADYTMCGTVNRDGSALKIDIAVKESAPELVGPGIVDVVELTKGEMLRCGTGWDLSNNTGYIAIWSPKKGVGQESEAVAVVVDGGGYPMRDGNGSRHLMPGKRNFTYYVVCSSWGTEKFDNDKEWFDHVEKFSKSHGGLDRFHYVERNEKRIAEIEAMLTEKSNIFFPSITNRSEWGRLAAMPGADLAVKRAEDCSKEDVAPVIENDFMLYFEDGNRQKYDTPMVRREDYLECMVLAECLEDRGRFMPKIVEYIEMILEEPTWVAAAHMVERKYYYAATENIDLYSSKRAYGLALVLRLLGDKLPCELVARTRSTVRRRVINPYLRLSKKFDPQFYTGALWFFCNYNWNSVCHSQCLGAILLMCEDRRERAMAIEFAERAAPHYLSGLRDDGYCVEGLGYWGYGFGHHLLLGVNILEATSGKLNILAGKKNLDCAKFGMSCTLGEHGVSPTFADGGGGKPSLACLKMCTMLWPKEFPGSFADCDIFLCKTDWPLMAQVVEFAFGSVGKNVRSEKAASAPLRSWFDCAKVLVCRIPGSEFSAAMKPLCRAEPHGHIDAGTYVVSDADGIFAGDVGHETYTSRTFSDQRWESKVLNSYGHPTPLVDGYKQQIEPWHGGEFVSVDFTDAADTYVVDLTDAYLEAKNLVSLMRTFRFDRKQKTFTVTDVVKFSKPSRFESPIVTIEPEKLKGRYEICAEGGKWETKEEIIENPGRPSPHRIAISFVEPVTEAKVSVTFR